MDEIKLKPCPFCGGKAEIRRVGDYKNYFVCLCSKCGKTPISYSEASLTLQEVIKKWNKRVQDKI